MSALDFGRLVSSEHPPFIITSLDCRELQHFDRALAAVEAAADARCDAIKLASMPWAWSARLYARAEERGVALLATALDESTVTRLDWLGAPAFYLVYDWSDLELVACAARTGKPMIMQIGTASHVEIAEVIETVHQHGSGGIALVQSVIDVELEGLQQLQLHTPLVGISDRSAGAEIPLAAISRGACIVEKRVTLKERELCASELAAVVRDCEAAWAAIGSDRRWFLN